MDEETEEEANEETQEQMEQEQKSEAKESNEEKDDQKEEQEEEEEEEREEDNEEQGEEGEEDLVPIRLNIFMDGLSFQDTFTWNLYGAATPSIYFIPTFCLSSSLVDVTRSTLISLLSIMNRVVSNARALCALSLQRSGPATFI